MFLSDRREIRKILCDPLVMSAVGRDGGSSMKMLPLVDTLSNTYEKR